MTVLGKDLEVGDRGFYGDEQVWTVAEKPGKREGHPDEYGLSLLVEKPNGMFLRISIGSEEPFTVEREKGEGNA